jgi:hypothetical protein
MAKYGLAASNPERFRLSRTKTPQRASVELASTPLL